MNKVILMGRLTKAPEIKYLQDDNKTAMARHIKTCVSEDIKEGNEEAVDELCELLKKLMK